MMLYIFFREDGWYPIEIDPDTLQQNIELNPGTIRVEDINGNVVWSLQ